MKDVSYVMVKRGATELRIGCPINDGDMYGYDVLFVESEISNTRSVIVISELGEILKSTQEYGDTYNAFEFEFEEKDVGFAHISVYMGDTTYSVTLSR